MRKTNKQSGQAVMELMVLLLSFIICFLGLIMIMGFSIANVEIFIDAKYKAESKAQFKDYGGDGLKLDDIKNWEYTKYDLIEHPIPFLPNDRPTGSQQYGLEQFQYEFDNPIHSLNDDKYTFNTFNVIDPVIANNIPYSVPISSYLAANLHRGKSNELNGDENVLLHDRRYFDRQKMYDTFETIIGTKLENINLEDNYSNTVLYPAMKILNKGVD